MLLATWNFYYWVFSRYEFSTKTVTFLALVKKIFLAAIPNISFFLIFFYCHFETLDLHMGQVLSQSFLNCSKTDF